MARLVTNILMKTEMKAIKAFTNDTIDQMEKFINQSDVFKTTEFKVSRRISFSFARKHSWGGTYGGRPGVNLAIWRYLIVAGRVNGMMSYNEYAHIKDDKVIGALEDAHWQKCLRALCAHEVAHALDKTLSIHVNVSCDFCHNHPTMKIKGHQRTWQFIYSMLRKEFVNNYQVKKIDFSAAIPRKVNRKLIAKVAYDDTYRNHGFFEQAKCTVYRDLLGVKVAEVLTRTTGHAYYAGCRQSYTKVKIFRGDDVEQFDADNGRVARGMIYKALGLK